MSEAIGEIWARARGKGCEEKMREGQKEDEQEGLDQLGVPAESIESEG